MTESVDLLEDKADPIPSPVLLTWRSWESVAVNVYNILPGITTFTLWDSFKHEGEISTIDIFDARGDDKISKGRIRFKPPPYTEIWSKGPYIIKARNGSEIKLRLELDPRNYGTFVDSPVRSGVSYPAYLQLPALRLDVCVLTSENTFHVMRTFRDSVEVELNVRRRELNVRFTTAILDQRNLRSLNPDLQECQNLFRLRIRDISFLAVLDTPAIYFRKLKDLVPTFSHSTTTWREFDAWSRQTALVHDPRGQEKSTTNLHRSGQIVDIGRWNVFKITFSAESVAKGASTLFHEILTDHNIKVHEKCFFHESFQKPMPVWNWINISPIKHSESLSSLLSDLANQEYVYLAFPVRYQLEVCISTGRLSEFTMTRDFILKLQELGESNAKRLLEHIATEKTSYINPMKLFDIRVSKGASDAKIPSYCCLMRTARITPSTIYYSTPSVDTSNRITRRYSEYSDHFLRVRFTDEKSLGRINSTIGDSQDEIYTRIKRTLTNGITIGDRHYEFLAFGNSQFREHGAYIFASTPHLNAAQIRAWMGQLSHIRNVAKYSARLGQSFSTTRAFGGCKAEIKQIEDISRNGHVFSDGVGKISKFLVSMISGEFGLRTPDGHSPSAFQFRLGGCKGMLVVSEDPGPSEIHIRPSQFKFESPHEGLEIIRSSQLSVASLNRQLILVLSSRGITDRIFHKKLNRLLENFDEAMRDDIKATGMLRTYIDPNQMSLSLAQMIDFGFRRTKEPFVYSMLALWKAWHLKLLKEKAKIVIEKGANLLGCLDETGICIVARNPSLHPGDIRVVRAVDAPQLRHLRDVVVFPRTGDQDIPSMCSGGDLDGDDYFVFWDQDLVPQSWSAPPMKFTSRKAPDLNHEVTVAEVTSFFVTYIKNDILPKVATAHMAWADFLPLGIRDDKCLRLARLHSDAVDYNKTGGAAVMTRDLEPRRWPHFMEKNHLHPSKTYHSNRILGQLYDAVEKINFVPHLSMPFDSRILNCKTQLIDLSNPFSVYARELKADYDSEMRRVMARYEIKTEFEVWSSWVLDHNGLSRDYNLHEDLGRISGQLRGAFRKQCCERVGGRGLEALAPLVVAMYRVTHEDLTKAQQAEEVAQYDDDSEYEVCPDSLEGNMAKLPLISFPWIFSEYLGRIAHGNFDLNAIIAFAATTGGNSNSKVYTQEEVMECISDLTIDEWSSESNFDAPTSQPNNTSAYADETHSSQDISSVVEVPEDDLDLHDSGIEIDSQSSICHSVKEEDTILVPRPGGPYVDENNIIEGPQEESIRLSSLGLGKLISMVEDI
ncbi:hypothetical protein N7450_009533 [Penicillium hetheringtonii]|uniref:RNA-dependent RNA polymerase n=1 Tax=Penicillium hetheringtonii TaxID=911720 RepID=A0AAD6DBD6_9EURO|nr:hypothetical protein N7450_009533 [Penicillium hetheringtonii]